MLAYASIKLYRISEEVTDEELEAKIRESVANENETDIPPAWFVRNTMYFFSVLFAVASLAIASASAYVYFQS